MTTTERNAPSEPRREGAYVTLRSRDNQRLYVRDKATRETLRHADSVLVKLASPKTGRFRKAT